MRLLLPNFLAFFVQFAQALLNSTPQLLARDRGAVAQGTQLGPGDLRMDAAAEAAVGAGDDVFSADDFSERDDAIGYHVRRGFSITHEGARRRTMLRSEILSGRTSTFR